MAQRIRTIKPEFFRHEDLFALEKSLNPKPHSLKEWKPYRNVRTAFAGLWTCCDREGRFEWRPVMLKSLIMPYDDVDFEEIMEALRRGSHIEKYGVNGKNYGWIPSWHMHQVVNPREHSSLLPTPPANTKNQQLDACPTRDDASTDFVSDYSGGSGSGSGKGSGSGSGKEGNSTRHRALAALPMPEPFDLSEAMKQFAGKKGMSLIEEEFAQFLDRHRSMGSRFVDWEAAWRNWVRNWIKFGGQSNAARAKPSNAQQRDERVREVNQRVLGVTGPMGRALRGELREGADRGDGDELSHRLIGPESKAAS